jgi:hypothetical protein
MGRWEFCNTSVFFFSTFLHMSGFVSYPIPVTSLNLLSNPLLVHTPVLGVTHILSFVLLPSLSRCVLYFLAYMCGSSGTGSKNCVFSLRAFGHRRHILYHGPSSTRPFLLMGAVVPKTSAILPSPLNSIVSAAAILTWSPSFASISPQNRFFFCQVMA